MESAWLARAAEGRPLAVVRVVVETADRNLLDLHTPAAGIRALRNLRRAASALDVAGADATDAYLAEDEDRQPQEVSA